MALMPASPLTESPFAVLTVVVAPAILTNACSVLALGTSNRMARVVDRTRYVKDRLKEAEPGSRPYETRRSQLDRLRTRFEMLVRALRILYAALGLFASAALVTVLGSLAAYYGRYAAFQVTALVAFSAGVAATACLVYGCSLMVAETRLALRLMDEEVEAVLKDGG